MGATVIRLYLRPQSHVRIRPQHKKDGNQNKTDNGYRIHVDKLSQIWLAHLDLISWSVHSSSRTEEREMG